MHIIHADCRVPTLQIPKLMKTWGQEDFTMILVGAMVHDIDPWGMMLGMKDLGTCGMTVGVQYC